MPMRTRCTKSAPGHQRWPKQAKKMVHPGINVVSVKRILRGTAGNNEGTCFNHISLRKPPWSPSTSGKPITPRLPT
jgi:hypothetical protein